MSGKPYIQQALGSLQSAAAAFRADAQAARRQGDADKGQLESRSSAAGQRRRQAEVHMAIEQDAGVKSALLNEVRATSHEIDEAKTHMQAVVSDAVQRAQNAERAASEVDGYVTKLNSLLGRIQ